MSEFPIWHLTNVFNNAILLYKSDDSNYIVTKDGEWTPILSCGIYIIVNQPLLSFFQQHLDVSLSSHTVSIYDRVFDKYFEGYHRVYIENEISPETLAKEKHVGKKIWCHKSSGGIFITSELKSILEQSDIQGVATFAGFGGYG